MAIPTPASRKGTAFKRALLQYVFLNQDIANIGDATGLRGSIAAGDLWLSLHFKMRGDTGERGVYQQTTYEYPYTAGGSTFYPGYTRIAVPRTAAQWELSGNRIRNKLQLNFPAITGPRIAVPGYSIDFWGVGIGTSQNGAGLLLYFVPCLLQTHFPFQQTTAGGVLTGYPASEVPYVSAFNLCVEEV